jgi:hypothetical protein
MQYCNTPTFVGSECGCDTSLDQTKESAQQRADEAYTELVVPNVLRQRVHPQRICSIICESRSSAKRITELWKPYETLFRYTSKFSGFVGIDQK